LTVTNEEGITSEPDEVTVIVSPISTAHPPTEEPLTIYYIIKNIIKNPLDITNSIDSSQEIINPLTDDNHDNDQIACNLLGDIKGKQLNNIR